VFRHLVSVPEAIIMVTRHQPTAIGLIHLSDDSSIQEPLDGLDLDSLLPKGSKLDAYRDRHNIAPDHPFWTEERILAALELGLK
jgi:hypothetical protein